MIIIVSFFVIATAMMTVYRSNSVGKNLEDISREESQIKMR